MVIEIVLFIKCIIYACSCISLLLLLFTFLLRYTYYIKRNALRKEADCKHIIGFYHPFTNAWGGGEKVLFMALRAIADVVKETDSKVVIYTVEDLDAESIINKAQKRFDFKLNLQFQFVRITKRYFTDQHSVVKLSLLSQAIGNIVSVIEAISLYPPDVFIDTIGAGFGYPFVKILSANTKLISYTHYPFIQSDMIERANTKFKQHYYKGMLYLYQVVGNFADLIMANSGWTDNHLCALWRCKEKIKILYPPCNTDSFSSIPLGMSKKNWVVSFAQFRREKDQAKQILAFKTAVRKDPDNMKDAMLMMIGSCRSDDDKKLQADLEELTKEEGIYDRVRFLVDLPHDDVKDIMAQAKVGIHTMQHEHFGISIVEMMAAGLITIAHSSGGPLLDIIQEGKHRGYLANSVMEYADAIVFAMTNFDCNMHYKMRENARGVAIKNFSDQAFKDGFRQYFWEVFTS